MKNCFSTTLSFSEAPYMPYEWDKKIHISGLKVKRVTHRCLLDLLIFSARIQTDERILLISDTNTSVVLRLDKKGNIEARSFLDFKEDAKVIEYAKHLKVLNLKYKKNDVKVIYPEELKEDTIIKEYLIKLVKSCSNRDLLRYLYYICFNSIKDFSKEKLIESIKNNINGINSELYNILQSAK